MSPVVKVTLVLVLLAASTLSAGDFPASSPEQVGVSSRAIAECQELIDGQVKNGDLAGIIVAVLRRGRMVHLKAYGYRDAMNKVPARTDDIVRIYSMSKPIVSVAAMQLWEQGRFQLDDPISKYIPAFRQMQVLVSESEKTPRFVPAKRQITVRDAFRHTTGIAYGGKLHEAVNPGYVDNGMVYWHNGMYPPKFSLLDGMTRLGRVKLLHQPGEKFTYGLNVDILGRLIEIWSGQTLGEYLQQAMFEPLGMSDTAFFVPPEKLGRFGPVHDKNDKGEFYAIASVAKSPYRQPPLFESGGGGLVSTITDYARFCQAMLNGGTLDGHRVLKATTVRLMFTNQLPETLNFKFGLGFGIQSLEFGTGATKRTSTAYRWGGYASTKFHVIPDEELSVITLRQRVPGNSVTWTKLVPLLHRGIAPLND